MATRLDPVTLFILAFIVTAVSGLSTLLRSDEKLTVRNVTATILTLGSLGSGMTMMLYTVLTDNAWFLLGLNMLLGLFGFKALMAARYLLQQGGVDIHIDIKGDKGQDEEENDDSSGDTKP